MTTSEIITLLLAVWGALLSTVLGVLTILRERREDGRLRIRVWVVKATGHDSVRPFCSFEVVNIGRRSVYFAGLILHDRKGKFVAQVLGPIEEGQYIKLEPGQACEDEPGQAFDDTERILSTRRIYAIDTLRGWTYLPRWRVWRMRRQVLKIREEHEALTCRLAAERKAAAPTSLE